MTLCRVALKFCDTIRLMSNDLTLKRPYEDIYGCFWPTPQFKVIIPNRGETAEKGAGDHKEIVWAERTIGIWMLSLGHPTQIRGEVGE
jgi:hypothetical protein